MVPVTQVTQDILFVNVCYAILHRTFKQSNSHVLIFFRIDAANKILPRKTIWMDR